MSWFTESLLGAQVTWERNGQWQSLTLPFTFSGHALHLPQEQSYSGHLRASRKNWQQQGSGWGSGPGGEDMQVPFSVGEGGSRQVPALMPLRTLLSVVSWAPIPVAGTDSAAVRAIALKASVTAFPQVPGSWWASLLGSSGWWNLSQQQENGNVNFRAPAPHTHLPSSPRGSKSGRRE